jgi:hypothetical protein
LEYLQQELKDKWGCNTLKEADKKLEQMDKEIIKLTEQIDNGMEKIEAEYGAP